jgi:RNA polymerase sigma-70 factor (ECF subfamily)
MIPERYATDVELLAGAATGEPVAVRVLLDLAGPTVYGFVFARVGGRSDAADDLVQETFVEAVRSAHTFRGDARVTTWLCTIARRRVARFYETERREELARSGLSVVVGDEEQEIWDEAADRDEIIRGLGRLPALHRQVLVLKYLDGLAVEEVATAVGRSRVQTQSLLQRARAGLKRELERRDD